MALTQIPIELSSTPGIVDNSNATAITIDSSENVMVGKTSASTNTVGVEARADGTFAAVKSGGGAAVFGRNTDDGTLVTFRKDGTTVGNISTIGGDFVVGSTSGSDAAFRMDGTNNQIYPSNATGSARDNAINLGASTVRWKDLYLSGGVYLGGTGSANKLDDYEEGTWTPTAGIGLSVNYANYIKIGSLVYINVDLLADSGSTSGSSFEISLPFSSITTYQAGAFSYQTSGFTDATVNITITIGFRTSQSGSNMTFAQAQGKRLIFSGFFKTSA